MSKKTARNRGIVTEVMTGDLMYKDIAEIYHLSTSRIRQIFYQEVKGIKLKSGSSCSDASCLPLSDLTGRFNQSLFSELDRKWASEDE